MKKLTTLIATLILALAVSLNVFAAPAQNVDTDDLVRLAEFAPAESVFFATIRLDDDYLATLDALLLNIAQRAPDFDPVDFTSISDALMQSEMDAWLGDRGAIFAPSAENMMMDSFPFVMIGEITNPEATEAALDDMLAFGYDKITTPEGFVRYEPEFSWDAPYLIAGDLLLFGEVDAALMPDADALRLISSDAFNNAADALPESAYNALVYLDVTSIYDAAAFMIPMGMFPGSIANTVNATFQDAGQFALGFTILDERTLVMDAAQYGASTGGTAQPLDTSLLDRVPANTPLVFQGRGFGDLINTGLNLFDELDALLRDLGELRPGDPGPALLGTFIRLSIEGAYGLDLDETLAWMNGDFVAYQDITTLEGVPLLDGDIPQVTSLSSIILSTDDAGTSAAFLDAIARDITRVFTVATYEDGTLQIPLNQVLTNLPEIANISITAADDVFIVGSSAAVDFALNPTSANLSSGEAFTYEANFFLPDAQMLMFMDPAPLRELAAEILESQRDTMSPWDVADAEMGLAILGAFQSLGVTSTITPDANLTRFTITFSED